MKRFVLALAIAGCSTVTVEAPHEVVVRCRVEAPAHWIVVTDGTERLVVRFPGALPAVLPCP